MLPASTFGQVTAQIRVSAAAMRYAERMIPASLDPDDVALTARIPQVREVVDAALADILRVRALRLAQEELRTRLAASTQAAIG